MSRSIKILGLLLLILSSGQAITITSGSGPFTFDFDGNVEGTDIEGLSATIDFSVTSFEDGVLTLDALITNTTEDPIESRIAAFGFLTDPAVLSAMATGAYGNAVIEDTAFPNQALSINICFEADSNNSCQGGPGGVESGLDNTGQATLVLDFGDDVDSVDITNFQVRYQSITGVTDCGAGDCGSGTGLGVPGGEDEPGGGDEPGDDEIPEPATYMMLGGGLLSLGLVRRYKR